MRWSFNGFVVDPLGYRLARGDQEIPLERRTFDLLCYLLAHRDRVVTKDELLEKVWDAKALSDGVLSNTVAKLRRALGQRAGEREPIETTHGRGYRFCAEASPLNVDSLPAPPTLEMVASRARDPFVGRKALMRALSQRLARAGGSENISVLAGEAGIGKTRTARELAAQARRENLRVWFGSAYEGVVTPPYWPWIQILRESSEDLSETTWQDLLPSGAGAIAQLVPELFRGAFPALSVEPQVARFRLFEEIKSLSEKCERKDAALAHHRRRPVRRPRRPRRAREGGGRDVGDQVPDRTPGRVSVAREGERAVGRRGGRGARCGRGEGRGGPGGDRLPARAPALSCARDARKAPRN